VSSGAVDMVWWLSLETHGPAFSPTVQGKKLYIVVVFVKAAWQKNPAQLSGLRRTERCSWQDIGCLRGKLLHLAGKSCFNFVFKKKRHFNDIAPFDLTHS
jgi:hypothetical protein